MKRIISDPLFTFLILSLFIFIYYAYVSDDTNHLDNTIVMTDHDIDRLIDIYQRTWSAAPDSLALRRLIDQELKNEIFYSEGLKMNLDHNDEIIRRRLVQKYEFLIKDISDNSSPTVEQLKKYYKRHQERYLTEANYTMSQYYFSPDVSDDAEEEAQQFYNNVRDQESEGLIAGNPLHLPREQVNKTAAQLIQDFGASFVEGVSQFTTTGWQEPIQSGYGWHVIKLKAIVLSEAQPFEFVSDEVAQDYRSDQLSNYNDGLYEALRKEYNIDWNLNKYAAWIP